MWKRYGKFRGPFGCGFWFGFSFPPFEPGFWSHGWRPFVTREEYLKMLEEYKSQLEDELREVEKEIERVKKGE